MTKTEIKKAINKAVYQFAESLGYDVNDFGDGSTVTFSSPTGNFDDAIDYQRSEHCAIVMNWASKKSHDDCEAINAYAEEQKRVYNV